ncbi:hypothetical protein BH23ACT5_BH23ACT5_10640 [soil metagenome]
MTPEAPDVGPEVPIGVSIVVAAYNAEDTIGDTLTSIAAQTHVHWEAIVVDDGSTDGTAEIAREGQNRDDRFRVTTRSNGGESAARNTGVAAARYDWLLFLDSDDWIAPDHLQRLTAEVDSDRTLDAVHCRWVRVAVDGTEIPEDYRPPGGDMFATWARRSAFPVHACIVRRALVEEVGRFDESLPRSADWDLWQRVARTGARFGVVDEVLAYYRVQPRSSSMDAERLLESGLEVLRRGQGPDERVPNSAREHAAGATSEGLAGQRHYLLAWCAGLAMGAGEDAGRLLHHVSESSADDLDPAAIARCLYESAILPSGGPPADWENRWADLEARIADFLADLERHSGTTGLASAATDELRRMILASSATWGHVFRSSLARADDLRERLEATSSGLAAAESRATGQATRITELELRLSELGDLSASLQARLKELTALPPPGRPPWHRWEKGRLLAERAIFRLQLVRMGTERLFTRISSRRPRVLAIACWSFPIYSQTFVYQELSQLIRAGFTVRFAYSAADRSHRLSSQFDRLWASRRRLPLNHVIADASLAHFETRRPAVVKELVDLLAEASGASPETVRDHYHFKQAFAFARMAKAYGPDYLHSYFFYEGALFALVASYLLGIPRGASSYADHMLDDYLLKVVGLHLRQCDIVIATSERIRDELTRIDSSFDPDKVVVKPNGIDTSLFPSVVRPQLAPGETFRLVSVSRLEEKKGLTYLVEAAAILRAVLWPVELHIVGGADDTDESRDYQARLSDIVRDLGLNDIVHFEGVRSEAEINDLFARCHVFVAPYVETATGDKDGIPTALLEAMSSGLTAVATDSGSIPEVITDGENGMIVVQRDAPALAAALVEVIVDPALRTHLGHDAGLTVRSRFEASELEQLFHDRLETIVSSGVTLSHRKGAKDGGDASHERPPLGPASDPESGGHPSAEVIPSPVVGLLTKTEREFLFHHARHVYTGDGAIVDLGCWLGSATLALSAGLSGNERAFQARVLAFDSFIWDDWMSDAVGDHTEAAHLQPGDSFLPLFEAQLAEGRERVEVRSGNLADAVWEGGPIALLFNDASKSWRLANAIWQTFYAQCPPHTSLIVEQDFAHFYTPWINLLHWRSRHWLEPVLFIPRSPSVVFRPVAPFAATGQLDFADFSDEEVAEAFEWSMCLVDPSRRPNVWAARVMVEVHRRRRQRALDLLSEGASRGLTGMELGVVQRLVDELPG